MRVCSFPLSVLGVGSMSLFIAAPLSLEELFSAPPRKDPSGT